MHQKRHLTKKIARVSGDLLGGGGQNKTAVALLELFSTQVSMLFMEV